MDVKAVIQSIVIHSTSSYHHCILPLDATTLIGVRTALKSSIGEIYAYRFSFCQTDIYNQKQPIIRNRKMHETKKINKKVNKNSLQISLMAHPQGYFIP